MTNCVHEPVDLDHVNAANAIIREARVPRLRRLQHGTTMLVNHTVLYSMGYHEYRRFFDRMILS